MKIQSLDDLLTPKGIRYQQHYNKILVNTGFAQPFLFFKYTGKPQFSCLSVWLLKEALVQSPLNPSLWADPAEAHKEGASVPPVPFFSCLFLCVLSPKLLCKASHMLLGLFSLALLALPHTGDTHQDRHEGICSPVRKEGRAGFKENCHQPVLAG